jgi:acetyl-CoA carboxylase biotin carboxylase subunit
VFQKILIANRGEIAVRVERACREMGVKTVAVYSEVDRHALHVRYADEAYLIGPPPAAESYLVIDKIIDVAKKSGAEAIHPGYGFLAENPRFADRCEKEKIRLIGPSAHAMRTMGSKTIARKTVQAAGVPVVPGTVDPLATEEDVFRVAREIGFPVMLKATAGGGGKGMRLVREEGELKSALRMAKSEAKSAFSDDSVYLERYIEQPRHVEIQILGDRHGNYVHLCERECSIQRRHQKVLEESPSPVVGPEMRRRMGEIAVRVAQTAKYTNAGTVEFLVDQSKNFYFLEMNTRLQVEHPVTELITGLDLVHLQIRIASGEKLPFTQEEVHIRGHAIECRIYAEDPDNNYFPSPGTITLLLAPAGPGIRRDSGMYEGWKVPIEYDPLLAKLIGYGTDRTQAVSRLVRALNEYFVGGIKTNISLFRRILDDADFLAGRLDTGYLDRLLKTKPPEVRGEDADVAAIAAGLFAVLEPGPTVVGGGCSGNGAGGATNGSAASGWKRVSRAEALR